jgi:hypothetical protein
MALSIIAGLIMIIGCLTGLYNGGADYRTVFVAGALVSVITVYFSTRVNVLGRRNTPAGTSILIESFFMLMSIVGLIISDFHLQTIVIVTIVGVIYIISYAITKIAQDSCL